MVHRPTRVEAARDIRVRDANDWNMSTRVIRAGGGTTRLPPEGTPRESVASHCEHVIRLNDVVDQFAYRGHDLCGIRVLDANAKANASASPIIGLSLWIGSQRCLRWDVAALSGGDELLGRVLLCDDAGEQSVLPMSLVGYMHAELAFEYDPVAVDSRATWARARSAEEEEEEEEVEVVASRVEVQVPEVEFSFKPTRLAPGEPAEVRFWKARGDAQSKTILFHAGMACVSQP